MAVAPARLGCHARTAATEDTWSHPIIAFARMHGVQLRVHYVFVENESRALERRPATCALLQVLDREPGWTPGPPYSDQVLRWRMPRVALWQRTGPLSAVRRERDERRNPIVRRASTLRPMTWRGSQMTAPAINDAPVRALRRRLQRAPALVWLVWGTTLASILVFIARGWPEHSVRGRLADGGPDDRPRAGPPALALESEQRAPTPVARLVNLTLLRATGDFRSTMVFDALALAAVAAAMILVARQLRDGHTSVADAFFPLLLLASGQLGQSRLGLADSVRPSDRARVRPPAGHRRPALAATAGHHAGAVALIGLPLSGANGRSSRRRSPRGWRTRPGWGGGARARPVAGDPLPAGAACLAILLCAVYFVGYEASPWNQPSPGPGATLETSGSSWRWASARSPRSGCSSASPRQ